MALRINDEVPNFTADTTQGEITFHDWIGDGWAILFSHPQGLYTRLHDGTRFAVIRKAHPENTLFY